MMRVEHPASSPDVEQVLALLARHEVSYVLAGSVAAQPYGVEVGQPGDLDIVPRLDAENLRRVAAALDEAEACLAGGPGHWITQPDGEKKWVEDEPTLEASSHERWTPDPADPDSFDHLFTSRYGNIDVVPTLSGTYEELISRAIPMEAHGCNVWVAHVDDLLATVTVPRRPKDVPRVRQLREIQRRRTERTQIPAVDQ